MTSNLMLDTNMVTAFARADHPELEFKFSDFQPGDLLLSVITEAEVLLGLAKTPEATKKALLMRSMLSRFTILPWTSDTAATYGKLRAEMRRMGKALSSLDMLIAAHALSIDATLVSADRAFRFVPNLSVEDWTAA